MNNKARLFFVLITVLTLAAVLPSCKSNGRSTPGSVSDNGYDCAVPAQNPDTVPRLQRDGRWLIDHHHRVVLSHGVNLVWKLEP